MIESEIEIAGVRLPYFIYGTAWKEGETCQLVQDALKAGFLGIDTANQRKHYVEAGVGEAIAKAMESSLITREQLFLQTKFTHLAGQDERLPYEQSASIELQVMQSFESSLKHLGVETIDSYVLHGPSTSSGLAANDWQAWGAMEKLYHTGKSRLLGVSNVTANQLELLIAKAAIKPHVVQNRVFASTGWDREVRKICQRHGVVYQGFSLLTANPGVLMHPSIRTLAQKYDCQPQQIVFRFAIQSGMIPLTGTRSIEHMRDDLAIEAFQLTPEEVEMIEFIAA